MFSIRVLLCIVVIVVLCFVVACSATSSSRAKKQSLASNHNGAPQHILVMSKTAGFRHDSIAAGIAMFKNIAQQESWQITFTEDAELFTQENLNQYTTLVFLNTTGDILNTQQVDVLKMYLADGKGFVGIHSATDTLKHNLWYRQMIGAVFASHPEQQTAVLHINKPNKNHPAVAHLDSTWQRFDEWYNFTKPLSDKESVLLTLDTNSFEGSTMTSPHAISWFKEFGGGRVFYTGLGHTKASYQEAEFIRHVREGVRWTMQQE